MKKILVSIISILILSGLVVQASDLVIESKTQSFNEKDSKIKFDGNVKVSVDDLKVVGDNADVSVTKDQRLDTATFYDKPYAFEIKKNKKREVKANILKVSLLTKIIRAEGDTQSIVFDGKTPIVVINSDIQEYNTKTGVMTATGAVTIKYKDVETFSNIAELTTDKDGELKRLVLSGNASVKQDKDEAYADRFVYTSSTGILTSSGNTTSKAVFENGDKITIKSNYQEYNQKTSVYNASGNVKIWYDDYFAQGPKVTLYPNKETNKPNEVYFTGRSSITQGVRTIFADKIKMVLKPKSFDAQGNTRTVIKNIGSGSSDEDGMSLGL